MEAAMSHDEDLADQDLEEVAEELWTLAEDGSDRLADLRATSRVSRLDAALDALAARAFVRVEAGRVRLTEEGTRLAQRQVRRHRLAEALFRTVLEVPDDAAVNRTACVMEHVLGPDMTDSICSFLGHPPSCPHGKPIPPGPCCRALSGDAVAPLVQPLERMPFGERARIVHIVAREPHRISKLSSLGVVPGAIVALRQLRPAAVLTLGETTLALDPEIARAIWVRKAS
jgi:DtxR family Mn-dependent transcriptional regulator